MKKNTKKTGNSNNNTYARFGITPPEPSNMDDLAYAGEDELARLHDDLFAEKDSVSRFELDTKPWEVEICYLQRELKIRSSRRTAHERFARLNPDSVDRSADHEDNKNLN